MSAVNGREALPESKSGVNTIVLDSIADGVFTVDGEWRITFFNRAAEQIVGVPRKKALGKHCWDIFRASSCERECVLRESIKADQSINNRLVYIDNKKGERIPLSISCAPLKDNGGNQIGGVQTFRDLSQVEDLHRQVKGQYRCGEILSRNHQMRALFDVLPTIASSKSTVLIQGESGTGKELFARMVHHLSGRRNGPFVAINCGALPDSLLESELFGYKAGAFTGAGRDKPGRFALAEGGTLFLDEIGDISPGLQVRLLRVLQERVFEPLGGTQSQKADVRVVAATHQDLEELVQQGRFRRDLFYRIYVIELRLPPLRERKEDIPLLADSAIDRLNKQQGKEVIGLSQEALSLLMLYDFPGNVRELENILERAFVLCGVGAIGSKHLPDGVRGRRKQNGGEPHSGTTLQEMEEGLIIDSLQRNDWNRNTVARELGIHRSTLFRKIKLLGIEAPCRDEGNPS
jgi:PAS domain S-box-containing protein